MFSHRAFLNTLGTFALLLLLCPFQGWAQSTPDDAAKSTTSPEMSMPEIESVRPALVDRQVGTDLRLLLDVARTAPADGNDRKLARFYRTSFGSKNFSGRPSGDDVLALQIGFTLGMLPYTEDQNPTAYRRSIEWLRENKALSEKLGADVARAFDAYLEDLTRSSSEANTNHDALVALFETTFHSLNHVDGDRRIHGYLLAGIWASFAAMDQMSGVGSKSLVATGDVLEYLFRKDAELARTDREIADDLATITAELRKDEPSQRAILDAISSMRRFASGAS